MPVFQGSTFTILAQESCDFTCAWSLYPVGSWFRIGQIRKRKVRVKDAQVDPQGRAVTFSIEVWVQNGQQAGLHSQVEIIGGYE